ncbi:SH2 domain-containing protein, partial [Planoprotostelium fungivorum]
LKALIAGRTELLNLRFPCVKGERYSDSNFWTTHETDESNSTKTVVSLKKLCYRFIYRNTQLYPKISDVLPHDLMEHYRCTFVDSITSDEAGRVLWKEYWLMEDDVPFNTFVLALSDMLKIGISQGSTHYITLQSLVRDIADSDSERITIETFSKLLEWFGPLDGQFLDKIAKIITKPWFHGNMTHMQAEKHIMKHSGTKKGTYLIRFSSKNRGYFTITVIGRNRTLLHYRVYYNRSEAKYNIGRSGFGSLDEIITNYSRELWLKMPCPGSKFATLNL